MKYWLTTHYPHPEPDHHPWHIYLQRKHKGAVTGASVGNQVFFYEFKRQKPIVGDSLRYRVGRMGIVRVARIAGPIYERPDKIRYTDGRIGEWTWGLRTEAADTNGFVPLKTLLPIIGYRARSVLLGFNRGTGVKELDREQAKRLFRAFKAGKARA